jgi:hypothetical protein
MFTPEIWQSFTLFITSASYDVKYLQITFRGISPMNRWVGLSFLSHTPIYIIE